MAIWASSSSSAPASARVSLSALTAPSQSSTIDRGLSEQTGRNRVFPIEVEGRLEGLPGLLESSKIPLRPTEADPCGDITGVTLETGAKNLDRLGRLAFAAQKLSELIKDPGRRVFPEQIAELLDSIIHKCIQKGPGPSARGL